MNQEEKIIQIYMFYKIKIYKYKQAENKIKITR